MATLETKKVEVEPTQEEKDQGILRKWEFKLNGEVIAIKTRHSTPQGHVPPLKGIKKDLDDIKKALNI
jgi:hypothetical protein